MLGDVASYEITTDGKKMLVKVGKEYAMIDLPKDKIETKEHVVKMEGFDMQVDRQAEGKQIYFEAWRQMREYFYSPPTTGVHGRAMGAKYGAPLPLVSNREDLQDSLRG